MRRRPAFLLGLQAQGLGWQEQAGAGGGPCLPGMQAAVSPGAECGEPDMKCLRVLCQVSRSGPPAPPRCAQGRQLAELWGRQRPFQKQPERVCAVPQHSRGVGNKFYFSILKMRKMKLGLVK